ncbi:MAG: hypothetical protein Q9219_005328 [cf. Caloplaca sp. 3 TL-2023]
MKTSCGMGLSSLLITFTTLLFCVTAVPTIDSTTSHPDNIIQARAKVPTEFDTLNLATDLFESLMMIKAIQLIGTQTNEQGINSLTTIDLSRLQAQGYNVTSLRTIFSQAASAWREPFPPNEEITARVIKYSSWIWIFQAVGALKGDPHRLNLLCKLIDVPSAFSVGQNGTLVKEQICNVGSGGELPEVPLPNFLRIGDPA